MGHSLFILLFFLMIGVTTSSAGWSEPVPIIHPDPNEKGVLRPDEEEAKREEMDQMNDLFQQVQQNRELKDPFEPNKDGEVAIVESKEAGKEGWTIAPFKPGFGLLENGQPVYGEDWFNKGPQVFPTMPVVGPVTIPVFLVDFSDFDPEKDPADAARPGSSIYLGYKKKTPEELSAYLNDSHGPAGYFYEVSGGQLKVTFEVHPWIVSKQSTYLKDRNHYYFYEPRLGGWVVDDEQYAKDVIRSAVVDLNVDLTRYDADQNQVLDGFVIVYEGEDSPLADTNLSWTNGYDYLLDNVAHLVVPTDPNYSKFASQEILFNRHNNLPEQNGQYQFKSVRSWSHEVGHLLFGYTDYYRAPTDLGQYALSARGGEAIPFDPSSIPFHPSALEKWLFAHWIPIEPIQESGTYTLYNHHLKPGETYDPGKVYLYQYLIDGDPDHFLTIENRYFLPEEQGGSHFNSGHVPIESGLVVFEVNRHLAGSGQIRRLVPWRVKNDLNVDYKGALQPGDYVTYGGKNLTITIDRISGVGEETSFRVKVERTKRKRHRSLPPIH